MLTLIVCLKPAWRTDVPLRLTDAGHGLCPDGAEPGLAAGDAAALATALELRARLGQTGTAGAKAVPRVIALSVGGLSAEPLLRAALAAGVDEALRVRPATRDAEDPPPLDGTSATTQAHALLAATALQPLAVEGPLLVLAGEASPDEGHTVFGAFLAHALGLSFAHRAVSLAPNAQGQAEGWTATVKLERGYTQDVLLAASAVVTVAPPGPALPEASWPAWLASRTAHISVLHAPPPERAPALAGALTPASAAAPAATAAQGATTTLRAPVPRVKRYVVPSPGLSAEQRIRALVGTQAQGSGAVLPAAEGIERQVDALVALLETRGYVTAKKT